MKWYKKYFENRRYFKCPECGQYFSLSFWEWLCAPLAFVISQYLFDRIVFW